jgi:hypothetical protein
MILTVIGTVLVFDFFLHSVDRISMKVEDQPSSITPKKTATPPSSITPKKTTTQPPRIIPKKTITQPSNIASKKTPTMISSKVQAVQWTAKKKVQVAPKGNVLYWNESTNQCRPFEICGNLRLLDIPHFNGNLPISLLPIEKKVHDSSGNYTEIISSQKQERSAPVLHHLYDSKATRKCLNNTKVCVLGDSTIEETIHDLEILLSGVGERLDLVEKHFQLMKQLKRPQTQPLNDLILNLRGSGMADDRAHRLMDIKTSPNPSSFRFQLFHRFTGHRNIGGNGEGISGMLYYLDLVQNDSRSHDNDDLADCDIFLLNSANHDYRHCNDYLVAQNYTATDPECEFLDTVYPAVGGKKYKSDCVTKAIKHLEHCLNEYISLVATLPKRLTSLYGKNLVNSKGKKIKFFWKGEAFPAYEFQNRGVPFLPHSMKQFYENLLYQKVLKSSFIRYINLTESLLRLPTMRTAKGPHIGQGSMFNEISNRNDNYYPTTFLWSSMSTQTVLNALCD